jgi:hypothetical protein
MSVVLLEVKSITALIFEKMFARYLSLHNHGLFDVLSSKNGVARK